MPNESSVVDIGEVIVICYNLKFVVIFFSRDRAETRAKKLELFRYLCNNNAVSFFKLKSESIQQKREYFLRQKSRQSAG